MHVVIAGVPRAGKSTLAEWAGLMTGLRVRRTDSLCAMNWSDVSLHASVWLDCETPSIIEGVAMPRALRKWLARSSGKPAEVVLWLDSPRVELTANQASMAQACRTVWAEVVGELIQRGVRIENL